MSSMLLRGGYVTKVNSQGCDVEISSPETQCNTCGGCMFGPLIQPTNSQTSFHSRELHVPLPSRDSNSSANPKVAEMVTIGTSGQGILLGSFLLYGLPLLFLLLGTWVIETYVPQIPAGTGLLVGILVAGCMKLAFPRYAEDLVQQQLAIRIIEQSEEVTV